MSKPGWSMLLPLLAVEASWIGLIVYALWRHVG
jgi:hypothetical protein